MKCPHDSFVALFSRYGTYRALLSAIVVCVSFVFLKNPRQRDKTLDKRPVYLQTRPIKSAK